MPGIFAMTLSVLIPATSLRARRLGTLLLSIGLIGCANFAGITPQATLRDATSLGLPDLARSSQASVDTQWWRAFEDSTLNQLEAQALQGNPSLKLAQARLSSAQANAQLTAAVSGPQLAAQLNLTQQHYTANGAVPPPLAGSVRDSGTAQFAGSWEIDFFGRNKAALQAALGVERAAQADAQAARVLLSAQVAQTYFAWVGLVEHHAVASRVLAQREAIRQLVQDRFHAGLDTPLDLRMAEAGLPEARLQLVLLDEQIALSKNALAALIGEPNRALAPLPSAQAAIKFISFDGPISSDLLGQRADVAAARWRVQAADQNVAGARAQFYPNINLTAFVGLSSIGLDKLLQSGSQQWGVGPALSLPLFDVGRLRANLGGKTAERDAAVESYNSTVINAVHEVADQLVSAQGVARQQAEQALAEAAAQDTYAGAQQRLRSGLYNALQVLNAESALLVQRRLAVDLRTRALQNQVALARALGGGFNSTSTLSN
jgi:NodT family efflux transporter outer membrane factor (OMF) lipoprotein